MTLGSLLLIFGLVILTTLILSCVYCAMRAKRTHRLEIPQGPSQEETTSMYTTVHGTTLEREAIDERLVDYVRSTEDQTLRYSSDDCERLFETNVNEFGLQMHSFRSRDELNEFWEATIRGGELRQPFVVRSLRNNATLTQIENFKKFQTVAIRLPTHPNVLTVIGLAKHKVPYRIYYEYHEETSLQKVIQKESRKTDISRRTMKLLHFAKQVASGMEFLKINQLDHVAIRTERVLTLKDGTCKLFDFCESSSSSEIALEMRCKSKALPWLAPEILWEGKYYSWTDNWAFGVLLWELWSLGKIPCVGKSLTELQTDLKYQRFLGPPKNCPQAMYSLMMTCWKSVPFERKQFNEINLELELLINNPEEMHKPTKIYSSRLYST